MLSGRSSRPVLPATISLDLIVRNVVANFPIHLADEFLLVLVFPCTLQNVLLFYLVDSFKVIYFCGE